MNLPRSYYSTARSRTRSHPVRFLPGVVLVFFLTIGACEARAQALAPVADEAGARPPGGIFQGEKPHGVVVVRGGATADPVANAVDEYRRTGSARTIRQSTFVAYPFGHSQPTLTCAPLRACVIELEAGEVLMAVIAGDTERWLMSQAFTGQDGDTPLVVVKPTDHDLTTNLVITTDRRIYELTLDAPPPSEKRGDGQNPQALYTRRIKFYYPDDMVRAIEHQGRALQRTSRSVVPMGDDFRLENLNFNYHWTKSEGFPFALEQVFDDGAHTYIKLPASAMHDVAPVLFILDGGERQILNYTVRGAGERHHYYITDRVFRHGVLVLGTRKKNWLGRVKQSEERLRILNLN